MAFSPLDTNMLATAAGQTLMLWDLAQGQITSSATLSNQADALAVSRDGNLLAVGGHQPASLELLRLPTLTRIWRGDGAPFKTPSAIVTFVPDGRSIICGGGVAGNPLALGCRYRGSTHIRAAAQSRRQRGFDLARRKLVVNRGSRQSNCLLGSAFALGSTGDH